jgi:energy-coupling factor transport system permease protein
MDMHSPLLQQAERRSRRHPVAWMVWTASASGIALLTRNPWYLLLMGGVALLVHSRLTGEKIGWGRLRLYVGMVAFPGLLNLVLSRAGETVLVRFPIRWIGGPYTLEGLLFGLSAGVQIACLVAIITAFSAAVSSTDILRRVPPGLYPAGLSASIGLTFAPQARRSFAAIREAQQVRGHQPRGWRDLPALVTPLVVMSLESAMGLAEGMVARGWGAERLEGAPRWLVPLGWLLLAMALVLWLMLPGVSVVSVALGLIAGAVLWAGLRRKDGAQRYRPETWMLADSLLAGSALGVFVVFTLLAWVQPGLLTYYPYPVASWPTWDGALALAVVILAVPRWMVGCR